MPPRSRARILTLIVPVVAVGLLARRLPSYAGDVAGAALYAVLLYLLAALVAPRARAWTLALVAAIVGALIELAQLTGVPAQLAAWWTPTRYVFGSTFTLLDLAMAVIWPWLGLLFDGVLRRRQGNISSLSGRP